QAQGGAAQAGVDGGGGARDRAERRATADIDGLAEVDLEAELIGRSLRPERIAGTGHRPRQDEAVDLPLLEAGLVEQRLEDLGAELPDVALALLHDLGFRVADDRRVTQCHARAPASSAALSQMCEN